MDLSSRTTLSRSTVLRAKRDTDLVKMMSISPARALSIIRMNSVRASMLVPEIPLSANTPANTQPGVESMSSL